MKLGGSQSLVLVNIITRGRTPRLPFHHLCLRGPVEDLRPRSSSRTLSASSSVRWERWGWRRDRGDFSGAVR